MVNFNLGLFLLVTGVAFLAGTVLRLLYAAYMRSRSERDVRNVLKNLQFKDIGEELESSSSEEGESSQESDVEMGGTRNNDDGDDAEGKRRRKTEASGEEDEEEAATTTTTAFNWSKQELAFPPLREKGIPPLTVKVVTSSSENTVGKEEKNKGGTPCGRGGPMGGPTLSPLHDDDDDDDDKRSNKRKPVRGKKSSKKQQGKENHHQKRLGGGGSGGGDYGNV